MPKAMPNAASLNVDISIARHFAYNTDIYLYIDRERERDRERNREREGERQRERAGERESGFRV